MRLHRRFEVLPISHHRPRHGVRIRLTALYGALFVLSGAALLGITDILSSGGHIYLPVVPESGGGGTSSDRRAGPAVT